MIRLAGTLAVVVLTACGPAEPPAEPPAGLPVVVATIFPVADLLRELAGSAARVETLLPPRASPATWEATPSQIRRMSGASGFVMVGGGLDAWLDELGADARLPVLRLSEGLALREAHGGHGEGHDEAAGEGSRDPHVWLDPLLVRDHLVPAMAGFLVRLVPEHAREVEARARALADTLTALDAEIRAMLANLPGREFIATHEAWTYFAARYGLTSLGSLYERPGHEPSARGLARLVERARATELGAVLAEPQLAGTAAQALAAELAGEVLVVDPLGGPGLEGRESYAEMMRFNARAFARAMAGP